MRILCFLIVLLGWLPGFGQEDLAQQYFREGAFDKAAALFERLVQQQPGRMDYADGLVAAWQQLEAYEKAEEFLKERVAQRPYPTLYVDLGYNYSLMGDSTSANRQYEQALQYLDKEPNLGYSIGYRFQGYSLLDQALRAYQKAMQGNPQLDYNFQVARIYGEQGKLEPMFATYLEIISRNPAALPNVLRALEGFISNDPADPENQMLQRLLLKRAQSSRDLLWNEMLSWLFVQQEQYQLAFTQEKAILKRSEIQRMDRIANLAQLARTQGDFQTARKAFSYMADESGDSRRQLQGELALVEIELEAEKYPDLDQVEKAYASLQERYGLRSSTIALLRSYANFKAFWRNQPAAAIALLKQGLELELPRYATAELQLELGDVLVLEQRFNEALVTYARVQTELKNDQLGQEARFRVARTSFYKGDFDWALAQLKVLRSSSSQLIANDAMQLSLLISDNSLEDSTRTALKKYARADLLAYQQQIPEAIAVLDELLQQHKGESVEDEALLRQASLYEQTGQYEQARENYEKIVAFFREGILADDAYFALGELHREVFLEPSKAMTYYEQLIFDYPDSYYYPRARQYYRSLRGDAVP